MFDNDDSVWKMRFEQEREARENAEKLLEEKKMEVCITKQDLENSIAQRTEELEDALAQATGANKAKDAFLSSMSHELRTPLNAIIGFSQILLLKPDTSEQSKDFIEKIQIAGKTLLSLVNTILDFSKMESGKIEISREDFNLEALFEEINNIVEVLLYKKNLTLTTDCSHTKSVVADTLLIKQALINLISNAIKFSPQGGNITMECHFDEEMQNIIFSVSDEGQGIDEEKKATLFKPFSQLANAKTVDEAGTGLGLLIIRKIAESHQGKVGIVNLQPKGSKFWISIPQKGVSNEQ